MLRLPTRALPSVIVDTEKVLREADGSVDLVVVRPHADGKVIAPVRLETEQKLARSPKIRSGDKRLNRSISSIHHTCEYKQCCHVGNTAKQCRLGLFQDSDFAGDLEDSKSTSGGTLCVFWKSNICSNQLDV